MPLKKYQSLADSLTQNKRLSKRRRGRPWTPKQDWPRLAFTRAVAGCFDPSLLEQTTIDFL
jgi:hypothetical protein